MPDPIVADRAARERINAALRKLEATKPETYKCPDCTVSYRIGASVTQRSEYYRCEARKNGVTCQQRYWESRPDPRVIIVGIERANLPREDAA